ncbi:MAG: hypothetical protein HC919_09330 [Oscillatoriales cyanobacterium SM2_2_1]|nr:hypothetical protein [Oscillatoriales cyanobacterium SM2_2_1]
MIKQLAAHSTLAVVLTGLSTSAQATTFTFNNITNGDTVGDPLAEFLTMDVTAASGGGVLFQFKNSSSNLASTSFIRQIFFDTRIKGVDQANSLTTILGGTTATIGNTVGSPTSATPFSTGTLNFTGGTSTGNFSQGNNLSPNFTTNFEFNRVQGAGNSRAIQPGETLAVIFSNATLNTVLDALNGGDLRVGYRLQGIDFGNVRDASDAYVNGIHVPARPVPVPGLMLGILAAGAIGAKRLTKAAR